MSTTAVPIKPVRKGSLAKLWIGLALLVLAAAAAAYAGTRGMGVLTTPSGLRYQVLKAGKGPKASATDVALIDYTGKLKDGTVFDSSEGKGPVPLPVTGSITGFAEGLQLMNKGAKYRLWIPSGLAYGADAVGPIPANSDLEFDVTLVDFRSMAALQQGAGRQQGAADRAAGTPGGAGAPPGM